MTKYSAIVVAFREEDNGISVLIGQTKLKFTTRDELVNWLDNSGVDFEE